MSLTLKSLSKTEAGEVQSFHYFSAKIRLSFSCESSARQAILMKRQALFSKKIIAIRRDDKSPDQTAISTFSVFSVF